MSSSEKTTFITICASVSYETVCLYTGETADLSLQNLFSQKTSTTKSNIDCLRLDQLHTLKSIYTYSYNIYYRVNLSYVLFIIFKLQVNLWCFDYDIYHRVNLRFVLILIFKLQGELMVCFDYDIYYRMNLWYVLL